MKTCLSAISTFLHTVIQISNKQQTDNPKTGIGRYFWLTLYVHIYLYIYIYIYIHMTDFNWFNYIQLYIWLISTGGTEACCPNFQNEPTTKPCLQQNCAYYIFYAILKWHRNGYKRSNINWQYVKSESAELFLSDPRLRKDSDFYPKNWNVARKNWRCSNLSEAAAPPACMPMYIQGVDKKK